MRTIFFKVFLLTGLIIVWASVRQAAQGQQFDFGDAPEQNYPTLLAQNGARHSFLTGFRLGALLDLESDGQPNPTATGDDTLPAGAGDDEDGVTFNTALTQGQVATVTVIVMGQPGVLNAWVDFSGVNAWTEAGEQIFTNRSVLPGNNVLTFNVPAAARAGATFARFRLTRTALVPPTDFRGQAPDGEVEDYQVTVNQSESQQDFGDAPDPTYPTLLSHNGARHTIVPGFHMGMLIDAEPDGQPDATATGDDTVSPTGNDDEDGVSFTSAIVAGQSASVIVNASSNGFLNAWMDFNGNGSWADSGEQIFTGVFLVAGNNSLVFSVPPTARRGMTFARFRFSHQQSLSYDGPSGAPVDGEVEDYKVTIERNPTPCDLTTKDTDFWLTFPGNYAPDTNNPVQLSFCILGMAGTTGRVDIPGLGFSTNFTIPASMEATVKLPKEADLGDANDLIENKGIHVTASDNVGVIGFNHVRYTTDAYLGLPSLTLGKEYIVMGYKNIYTGVPPLNGTQFAIVACESNTQVTITVPVNTGSHTSGVPFNITLNQGQTYQLRNINDAPADLSGTIIQSDKPVAVFGSHQVAAIPNSTNYYLNYIVEHLLPVSRAGTSFVTMPLATRTGGDTFRFLAVSDGTTVSVNGVPQAPVLNRGQFIERIIAGPAHITADKRILVTQYANSADFDPPPGTFTQGDPFMVVIPHTGQYFTNYMVCVPTNDFSINYINIVVPTASVGSVRVDGVFPPVAFVGIGASGFSGAQVPVTTGPHIVSAAVPIGVIVYGWAEYDSYGYPGGLFVGDNTPPTITCLTSNVTVQTGGAAGGGCRAQVPDLRQQVQVSDECDGTQPITITQQPPPGTLVGAGQHPVTMTATDANGNSASCVILLTVQDPNPPVIICPTNMAVRCTGTQGTNVTYSVTLTGGCNPSARCTPPSGSLFPAGTTTVNCVATNDAGSTASCSFTVTVTSSAAPTIISAGFAGGRMTFSFASQAGCTYTVLFKNNLNQTMWQTLGAPIMGDGTVKTVSDSVGGLPMRFYQLRVP